MILILTVMAGLQAQLDDPACLFDGGCAKAVAAAPAAPAAPAGPRGPAAGLKKGAKEGALLGFLAVEAPAVALLSEGFGRDMSRAYDGARADNGGAALYNLAGAALAAVLYLPALALGAAAGLLGALAGTGAELVEPGSTRRWDAEKLLD